VYSGLEIHLHHRDWAIVGDGVISLGKPVVTGDPHNITFSLKALP
jgi:hypothetical protein